MGRGHHPSRPAPQGGNHPQLPLPESARIGHSRSNAPVEVHMSRQRENATVTRLPCSHMRTSQPLRWCLSTGLGMSSVWRKSPSVKRQLPCSGTVTVASKCRTLACDTCSFITLRYPVGSLKEQSAL